METAILEPYFRRIEQRHGLTKSMNQWLRSHPVMVDMVRQAVSLLARTEALFGTTGTVRMTRQQLYRHLQTTCDSLADNRRPKYSTVSDHFGDAARMVKVGSGATREIPDYHLSQYQVFNMAMTVAKHVGLIAGWGRCGLHPDLLKRLRRKALTRPA